MLSGLGYSPAEIGRLRTAGALADDGLTELPDEAISAIPAISASDLAIPGGRSPPGKTLVAETLVVGLMCAKKACVGGDPVVDGAKDDVGKARQILVGGAQQAEHAGQLAVLGLVEGGTSRTGHVSMLLCCAPEQT